MKVAECKPVAVPGIPGECENRADVAHVLEEDEIKQTRQAPSAEYALAEAEDDEVAEEEEDDELEEEVEVRRVADANRS